MLLTFSALEDGGIDYRAILAACGIVVGNIWTGFLATRDSPHAPLVPVSPPADGVLRGRNAYFFQLPDADVRERPYPVVARFQDWCFPHDNLPPPWNDPSLTGATTGGRLRCCITDAGWAVEKAHLVPRAQLR